MHPVAQLPSDCNEPAARRCTNLACKESIEMYLECTPFADRDSTNGTKLCDIHYRALHKGMKPDSYQWKCAICSMAIRGSNYHNFKTCSEPGLFQNHLHQHTDFEGQLSSFACSRTVVKLLHTSHPTSSNRDLNELVNSIKHSLPEWPYRANDFNELLQIALKLAIVDVAQELLSNHAMTLLTAYSSYLYFIDYVQLTSTCDKCPERVGTPDGFLASSLLISVITWHTPVGLESMVLSYIDKAENGCSFTCNFYPADI